MTPLGTKIILVDTNRFLETLVVSYELFKQDSVSLDYISSMCGV